jgi:hypothetical protein
MVCLELCEKLKNLVVREQGSSGVQYLCKVKKRRERERGAADLHVVGPKKANSVFNQTLPSTSSFSPLQTKSISSQSLLERADESSRYSFNLSSHLWSYH